MAPGGELYPSLRNVSRQWRKKIVHLKICLHVRFGSATKGIRVAMLDECTYSINNIFLADVGLECFRFHNLFLYDFLYFKISRADQNILYQGANRSFLNCL